MQLLARVLAPWAPAAYAPLLAGGRAMRVVGHKEKGLGRAPLAVKMHIVRPARAREYLG